MSLRFLLDRCPSPIGVMLLVSDTDGHLRALDFEEYEQRMHRLLRLQSGDFTTEAGSTPYAVKQALTAYFTGEIDALNAVSIRTGGTEFQRQVWRALRELPAGATTSYGRLAATIGHPKASRAVGMANGSNPIALVVPCHRVIGANGSLTGYGGGLPRKQWLIQHEREHSHPLDELAVVRPAPAPQLRDVVGVA
jgi:methylated-DNA-[protein]-cysteine S-methyltransferase